MKFPRRGIRDPVGVDVEGEVPGGERIHGSAAMFDRLRFPFHDGSGEIEGKFVLRLLIEEHLTAPGIEGGRHEVPGSADPLRALVHSGNRRDPGTQRGSGAERLGAEPERERSVLLDEKTVAALVLPGPLGEYSLRGPRMHRGRSDPGGEGEAPPDPQIRMIGDDRVGSHWQVLALAGMLAADGGFNLDLLDAGPVGIRIAVDQPHDIRPISRGFAAYHESDRLSGRNAQLVRVPDDSTLSEIVRDLLRDGAVARAAVRGRSARLPLRLGLGVGATENAGRESSDSYGLEKVPAVDGAALAAALLEVVLGGHNSSLPKQAGYVSTLRRRRRRVGPPRPLAPSE